MMVDHFLPAEDREVVGVWTVRLFAAVFSLAALGAGAGLAVRLFGMVAG